jgi:OHCU decarboxylase
LSEEEQAGLAAASDEELDRLAAGNREYEAKFGYLFIACAAGQSASALLDMLQERLGHDPAQELMVAAEEQAKITALRLDRAWGVGLEA